MYLNQKIHVVLSGIVTVSLLVSCNPGTDSSKKRSQLQGADAQSTGSQTPTDTDAKQPNSVPNNANVRPAAAADVELLVKAGLEVAPAAAALKADPQRFHVAMDAVVKEIYRRQSEDPTVLSKDQADKLAVLVPQFLQSLSDHDSAKTADFLKQISELTSAQPAVNGLGLAEDTGVVSKSLVPQGVVNMVVSFTGKIIEFGAAVYGIKLDHVDRLLASGINLLNALLAGGPEAQSALIDVAKSLVSSVFSLFTAKTAPVSQPASVSQPETLSLPPPLSQLDLASKITYTNTIKAYLDKACTSCHGLISPNLSSYASAKNGAQASLNAMSAGTMPKSGKAAQTDIDNLAAWIKAGMPQ